MADETLNQALMYNNPVNALNRFRVLSSLEAVVELRKKLECGPVPNVMATLPNIGGALCSMPQFG